MITPGRGLFTSRIFTTVATLVFGLISRRDQEPPPTPPKTRTRMRDMKTRLLAAATLLCRAASLQAKDIKVAHVYDQTGPLEAYAKQTQTGVAEGAGNSHAGPRLWRGGRRR